VVVFCVFLSSCVLYCVGGKEGRTKKKRKRLALKKWCFALVGVGWFGRFGLDLLKKLGEIFFWVFVFWVLMVNRFYWVRLFLGWSTD
jgi:hypothetical protein